MLFYTFFAFLTTLRALALDCTACAQIRQAINKLDHERAASVSLYYSNQEMLKRIGPNDLSKRVKLTSNVLILSSRIETLENTRAVRLKDSYKYRCDRCQPVH